MKIVKVSQNESFLRKKCVKVTKFDRAFFKTIQNMASTMTNNGGVGLAAPQVGISSRFFVARIKGEIRAFINPEIIELSEEKVSDYEGCLSVENCSGLVSRSMSITLKYFDGKKFHKEIFLGYSARIIQHEMDHLDGILYIDKCDELKKVC